MASSTKTPRDSRLPKCSILLNNAMAITFAPCSIEVDQNDVSVNNAKPQHSCSGKKLFDAFVDNNMSTLHTRLNECLSEIRFAGWIHPYTILVKGPQEEMNVLTEAWRRRFLRSPSDYTIREIGEFVYVFLSIKISITHEYYLDLLDDKLVAMAIDFDKTPRGLLISIINVSITTPWDTNCFIWIFTE